MGTHLARKKRDREVPFQSKRWRQQQIVESIQIARSLITTYRLHATTEWRDKELQEQDQVIAAANERKQQIVAKHEGAVEKITEQEGMIKKLKKRQIETVNAKEIDSLKKMVESVAKMRAALAESGMTPEEMEALLNAAGE